jgi:hypothetical protein
MRTSHSRIWPLCQSYQPYPLDVFRMQRAISVRSAFVSLISLAIVSSQLAVSVVPYPA